MKTLTLMAILAHPDDESLGFGGTLASYAAEGIRVTLVTATRGDRGRYQGRRPGEDGHPGQSALAALREQELRAAASALGISDVTVLDYGDQQLATSRTHAVISDIAGRIRAERPDVVVTFGMDGAYGHPDHIAISQFTSAAIVAAAGVAPNPDAHVSEPHAVSKLYHLAWPAVTFAAYQEVFGELTSTVDGTVRRVTPTPEWAISADIDATAVLPTVLRAALCHESQVAARERLRAVSPEQLAAMWARQSFYRVFSNVDVGAARETDLFEGLR